MNKYITFNPSQMSINPTDRKTIKHVLSIDTLYRKNYSTTKSSDFTFILPSPIQKVIAMKIAAIEFPNAWYTFADENQSNIFTITLYNCPTPGDVAYTYPSVIKHVITIPEGNYRSDLFSVAINNIFSNTRNGLEYIYAEVNENDARMYFRTKNTGDDNRNIYLNSMIDSNFYFTLDFVVASDPERPLYKNAGWMMGFRQPFYTVAHQSTPTIISSKAQYATRTYNWYLSSDSTYGGNVQNYIYLEIDDFNRNCVTNTFYCENSYGTYLGNNIMGRISVSSGMNTIVTNTASDLLFKTREYFGPVRLEKLHIRLLNKYGDLVPLNANDFSLMLELDVVYS